MNNQKGFALAPLLIIIAVLAAASIAGYVLIQTNNTSDSENTNINSTTPEGSLTQTLASLSSSGGSLTFIRKYEATNLPSNVFSGQVGPAFVSGDIVLLVINQRNMNTPVYPVETAVQWAGVLGSLDGGSTWQQYYAVTLSVEHDQNVTGIFISGEKLYLDIADARGAGSGEGFLTRLASSSGGVSWTDSGCYYLMPENYFTDSVFTPENLETEERNRCQY